MKKFLPYITIFVVLVGVLLPTQHAHAQLGWLTKTINANGMLNEMFNVVAHAILGVASYFMWFTGSFLNYVLKYTIMNMRDNLSDLTGINDAWKVIKDLMNIVFIFMLVYQGILIILNMAKSNIKNIITGIVLSALLINFSLFFTKILIDASNIVTIGLYQTITDTTADINVNGGLSNTVAGALGLSTFYGEDSTLTFFEGNDLGNNMVRLLLGLVLVLIASFIFLAIGVVFLVRYIVLIILLALSPIAYMGMGIPQLKSYANQWWETLQGQLLFGPIYMIFTWVALTLMASEGFINSETNTYSNLTAAKPSFSSFGLIVNFGIIIGLLIASLIVSKSTASKGSKYIGQATKWATGAAGGVMFGAAAGLGRNTIGKYGSRFADSEELKRQATEGNLRQRLTARTALAVSNKAASGSFDPRATKAFGGFAKATGVGDLGKVDAKKVNYRAIREQQQKDDAKQAEKFKPSDLAAEEAKRTLGSEEFKRAEAEREAEHKKRISSPEFQDSPEMTKEREERTRIEENKRTAVKQKEIAERTKAEIETLRKESGRDQQTDFMNKELYDLEESMKANPQVVGWSYNTKKAELTKKIEDRKRFLETDRDFNNKKYSMLAKADDKEQEYKQMQGVLDAQVARNTQDEKKLTDAQYERDNFMSEERKKLVALAGGTKIESLGKGKGKKVVDAAGNPIGEIDKEGKLVSGRASVDSAYVQRMEAMAKREEGKKSAWWNLPANVLGTVTNTVGITGQSYTKRERDMYAAALRKNAKSKTNQEKLKDIVKDLEKEDKSKEEEEDTTTSATGGGAPTAPATPAAPSGGGAPQP